MALNSSRVWQPVLLLSERPITDEEQRFLWEMPGGYARIIQRGLSTD